MTNKNKNLNSFTEISKAIKSPDGHYFFGYYDICPWDKSENYLLAHKSNFIDRPPKLEDNIEIGFVNLNNRKFISVDKTSAWNFQQGARLQWLPNSSSKFIYNTHKNNSLASVIYDIKNDSKKELSSSIYSLSPNKNIGLTVNYRRLERLGGYGYKYIEDKYNNKKAPKKDGIYKVNLDKNKRELILSINKVAKFKNPSFSKINSDHYLELPTFNQKGNRFCFLHRFKMKDGGIYSRLLTSDINGSNLCLVTEGTLSHFDWFDNEKILIWGRTRSYLTKARKYDFFNLPIFKPVLNYFRSKVKGYVRHKVIGDKYLLFQDKTSKKLKSIGEGKLSEDGHPTRYEDSNYIITDTYPDENHYRTLTLFNLKSNKKTNLGKFYSIPNEKYLKKFENNNDWDLSSMRSDLHPRWNRSGSRICIDSVHDGRKQIYILDISKNL